MNEDEMEEAEGKPDHVLKGTEGEELRKELGVVKASTTRLKSDVRELRQNLTTEANRIDIATDRFKSFEASLSALEDEVRTALLDSVKETDGMDGFEVGNAMPDAEKLKTFWLWGVFPATAVLIAFALTIAALNAAF